MADKDRLREVLTGIGKVMDNVVNARNILFPKNLRSAVKDAWDELNADKADDPRTLAGMKSELDKRTDDELADAGLSGNQLDLKCLEFFESYNDLDCKGGVSRLKRFVKFAKFIVSSMSKIIPALEILLEFLEAVEWGIEKAEEP